MKPKYKVGDVVYAASYEYLNQKLGRYHHKPWEKISALKVRVIRTVVKSVLGWKKQFGGPVYVCLGDMEYPELKLYATIYDALESFPVGEPVLYVWKNNVPVQMNQLHLNITKPIEWFHAMPIDEVHATMGA